MKYKTCSFYFIVGCILIFTGFFTSLYLSISHYRVYTDIGYSSFCALSKSINCDTVSQSSFSILFGMPVPIWGVIGFTLLILLFPFLFLTKNKEKRLWSLFYIIISFYSIYSFILAFISTFYINSYCLMCILVYAINFMLLFYSYIGIKKYIKNGIWKNFFKDLKYLKLQLPLLSLMIQLFSVAIIILWLLFPKYWNLNIKTDDLIIPSGVTEDGSNWIGAQNPDLVIIEYTDYLCFQCKKMHFYLRALVSEHPDKIRLVHRHFPLDKQYNFTIKEDLHKGAGEMAMLAIYAGIKNRFWEMNDLLFQIDHSKGIIDLNEIAKKTNFKLEELSWALGQKAIRLYLKKDIAMGARSGITGTPAYIVRDKLYLGTIPPEILNSIK
jgi:protein-disulfide isomerase/uncharacterized membrane protein